MHQFFIWNKTSISECHCLLHVIVLFSSRVARFWLNIDIDFDIPVEASEIVPVSGTGSRKRSIDGASHGGSTAGGASTKKSKQVWSMADKEKARPTGRRCTCCGKYDTDQDPCTPKGSILWSRYLPEDDKLHEHWTCVDVVIQLKTEGGTCWYCFRQWAVVFMTPTKYKRLDDWKKACHSNEDLGEQRVMYTAWLVQEVIRHVEAGHTRDSLPNLDWPSEVELLHLEIVEIAWTKPEEKHLPLIKYQTKHGAEWEKHALLAGDKVVIGPSGKKDMVLLSSEDELWTKTTRSIQQATKKQNLGGRDAWGQKLMDARHANLAAAMEDGSAVAGAAASVLVADEPSSSPVKSKAATGGGGGTAEG